MMSLYALRYWSAPRVNSSVSRQWLWDRKARKAPKVYGGGAVLDRMSRNEGGGIAMEEGLDWAMVESVSEWSESDENRADFLRDGLRLKVRSRAGGILPNTERPTVDKARCGWLDLQSR